MFTDPKVVGLIGAVVTGLVVAAGKFIWSKGVAAGEAGLKKKLDDLYAKREAAKATPSPDDDHAFDAEIATDEALLAAIKAAL